MEQWRDIPGYVGIYQASDMGNIRTCAEKTTYTERHGIRHWKQRALKQKYTNKNGRIDARVMLWKDGEEKTWLVARLVGLAWCDGYSDGMTINHINGNSSDNRAENLEWVTLSENVKKGHADGLFAKGRKAVRLVYNDFCDIRFVSMAEASRYIGRQSGYISNRLKRGNPIKDSKGNLCRIIVEE